MIALADDQGRGDVTSLIYDIRNGAGCYELSSTELGLQSGGLAGDLRLAAGVLERPATRPRAGLRHPVRLDR